MAAHTHRSYVAGCFRCDLSRHETERAEAKALREMAQDFRDIGMNVAAELCDEKADDLAPSP